MNLARNKLRAAARKLAAQRKRMLYADSVKAQKRAAVAVPVKVPALLPTLPTLASLLGGLE